MADTVVRTSANIHLRGSEEREYLQELGVPEHELEEEIGSRKAIRRISRKREAARLHYWRHVDSKREEAQVRNRRRAQRLKESSADVQEAFRQRRREVQKDYYYRNAEKLAQKQKMYRDRKRLESTEYMANSDSASPANSGHEAGDEVHLQEENGTRPVSPTPSGADELTGAEGDAPSSQKVASAVASLDAATNTSSNPTSAQHSSGNASGSAKVKKRGSPSHFTEEQIAFLEDFLQAYIALQKGSKEKELFLRDVIASFLELFPIEVYGAPPINPKLSVLEPKTQVEIDAMSSKQRKSYMKMKAVREANDEQRLANAIKNWFFWRQGSLKKKADELNIGKFINDLRDRAAPRKRQMTHFVMTHPNYKAIVKENSKEEGPRNRLACRRAAAKDLLQELEAEGKLADLLAERDAEHEAAMAVWNSTGTAESANERDKFRASLGHITQPLINRLSDETGLHFVLLAGEDTDGQGNFKAMAVTSHPDKYTPIDKFHVADFQTMTQVFYKWLQMIRLKDGPTTSTGSATTDNSASTTTALASGGTSQHIDPVPTSTSAPPTFSPAQNVSIDKPTSKTSEDTRESYQDKGNSSEVRGLDSGDGEDITDGQTNLNDGGEDMRKEAEKAPEGSKKGQSFEELRRATIAANQAALRKLQVESGLFTEDGTPTFLPSTKKPQNVTKAKVTKAKQKTAKTSSLPTRRSARHQNKDPLEIVNELAVSSSEALETDDSMQDGAAAVEKGTNVADAPARDERGFLREQEDMEWIHSPTDEDPSVCWKSQDPTGIQEPEVGTSDSGRTQPGASDGHVGDSATNNTSTSTSTTPNTPDSPEYFLPTEIQDLQDVYGDVEVPTLRPDQQYDPNGVECPPGCTRKLSIIDFLKFLLHVPEGCSPRPGIWSTLVYKWVDLEERWRDFGIEEKAISTKLRVHGFDWWHKNGRFRTTALTTPAEAKTQGYGVLWWKWWTDVNPAWRRKGDAFVLPNTDGDLDELHRPGKAGLVVLLVGLRWWYDGNAEADASGLWTAAVKSLFVTFEALMHVIKHLAKDKHDRLPPNWYYGHDGYDDCYRPPPPDHHRRPYYEPPRHEAYQDRRYAPRDYAYAPQYRQDYDFEDNYSYEPSQQNNYRPRAAPPPRGGSPQMERPLPPHVNSAPDYFDTEEYRRDDRNVPNRSRGLYPQTTLGGRSRGTEQGGDNNADANDWERDKGEATEGGHQV
ncbi:SERTA domain-containing protein 3 [Paramarasmius palmivorus]|uniref:SERTA domain-containing protein 3 n=1 Tax=Paramarasmius palmivorus TaxID=297713 RepID=A0AAW0B9L9_9AGAR